MPGGLGGGSMTAAEKEAEQQKFQKQLKAQRFSGDPEKFRALQVEGLGTDGMGSFSMVPSVSCHVGFHVGSI